MSFVNAARQIVRRLGSLDKRRVVFGAGRHDYRFEPRISESTLVDFEAVHEIVLPPSYRAYITALGNGGPGPHYGVTPLCLDLPRVGHPFPFETATEIDDDAFDELPDALDGAVHLAEVGCGTYALLVVCGVAAGQVWYDARYEGGIDPAVDPSSGLPLSFDQWWLGAMELELALFERVDRLIRARTPHDEIHTATADVLDLRVDEAIVSILDGDTRMRPASIPDKPWGMACGRADEIYGAWLGGQMGRSS